MQSGTSIELARDCEAVQIPYGSPVLLPKGSPLVVTQTLGGTYTVRADSGLYRIASKDADALGIEVSAASPEARVAPGQPMDLDEKEVWETLRTCFDPEIPVNIVDLGLVYD